MQNAAEISAVSWISKSVAPSVRARSMSLYIFQTSGDRNR
jgi:hypothetical protein